jgi:hypothetical protein
VQLRAFAQRFSRLVRLPRFLSAHSSSELAIEDANLNLIRFASFRFVATFPIGPLVIVVSGVPPGCGGGGAGGSTPVIRAILSLFSSPTQSVLP